MYNSIYRYTMVYISYQSYGQFLDTCLSFGLATARAGILQTDHLPGIAGMYLSPKGPVMETYWGETKKKPNSKAIFHENDDF